MTALALEREETGGALLDRMGRRLLKRQIEALKSLPSFPRSVLKIQSLVASEGVPETAFKEIAAIIESDPALCARVLKMVNAAFYGTRGPVVSVLDALVMLGFEVVRGVLLSAGALEAFGASGGFQADLDGLWAHSFGAGVAASALARVLRMPEPGILASAALMHDLGKVALITQLGDDYSGVVASAVERGVPIRQAEAEIMGVTHDEIGRWLVTRWRFPEPLAMPIAWHHTPEQAGRYAESAAVIHVADLMIRGLGFGFPGDYVMPDLDVKAWKLLSLNGRKIEQAVSIMQRELHGAMAAAQRVA
ncbi:MAG: HDOD domain-containing protein [Bradymonadia bacterium]